jgi:hypothetical protein
VCVSKSKRSINQSVWALRCQRHPHTQIEAPLALGHTHTPASTPMGESVLWCGAADSPIGIEAHAHTPKPHKHNDLITYPK